LGSGRHEQFEFSHYFPHTTCQKLEDAHGSNQVLIARD
jgi:hypothetical protein